MGIQSLKRNNALIMCRTGEIWFLGEGGAEVKLAPGSRHFQMVEAPSGHWLLPVSRFSATAQSNGVALITVHADLSAKDEQTVHFVGGTGCEPEAMAERGKTCIGGTGCEPGAMMPSAVISASAARRQLTAARLHMPETVAEESSSHA